MELPLHSSVEATAVVVYPPKAIEDVIVPPPPCPYLAVLKSATSVQLAPFQSSVIAFGAGCPPKTKAAV